MTCEPGCLSVLIAWRENAHRVGCVRCARRNRGASAWSPGPPAPACSLPPAPAPGGVCSNATLAILEHQLASWMLTDSGMMLFC